MPLVTRLGKGSRLTVEEMDGNFTYLEDLALSEASSSLNNGYRGFYAGINRIFGDDPNITQIIISKSATALYDNKESYETDNDDFYVTNLSGSDTVVIMNLYGLDSKKPLKIKHIRNFVERFIDIVLYTNETLNTDLEVIRDLFYDNIELLTSSLPAGSLYNQFVFQDKDVEYNLTSSDYTTTSMTGSGTFSISKLVGDDKGYNFFNDFTYGFQQGDIITIPGTALGGQSPANDATIFIDSVYDGVISELEIDEPGTGYTNGNYYIFSGTGYAYVDIITASGSITGAVLTNGGSGFELGTYTINGGNDDATINVLSIKNGAISEYNLVGTPDYRSPYRNSENPWPVMSINDGGSDQYDTANYITTDKSITQFIGSIEEVNSILTVTEIISGTISVGQTVRHRKNEYEILTGTPNGGVGTYSVSSWSENDLSEQIFTAYGINYGAGEIVENNTFGTGSSYITLYDESIFAMIAINTDIDKVWYNGDSGSDGNGKKQVSVLIADNNTLSFADEKLELSNKDLALPETETLAWMSVLGPLYNNDNDIIFNSAIIDDYENTYAVGYEQDNNYAIVIKFNKQGDKLWSRIVSDDDNGDSIEANKIEIDPTTGDLLVLCQIYPNNYAEGLIVRIDPMTGQTKTANRLKDLNGLEEQGDIYLYDMTFNSDNEIIIVGQKTTDYLEWTIATSSVLLGSTVSTLVISPSSIGNDIPEDTYNWSIAGTGIIGDETLSDINYFTGLTGSVLPGGSTQSSGAVFNIEKDQFNGNYNVYVMNGGSNYLIDDIINISGDKLGGTSSNDCLVTITDVTESGGINNWIVSGTGSTASLYLTINTNVDFTESGTWSIYKSLNGESYIYTENWEKTLVGDEQYDRFSSVLTDNDNNIYCIGEINSVVSYDKAIVSKFNQNGVQQWTKVLNEIDNNCSGKSIAILGTNSLVTTHYSDNDEECIISKLTFDGDLIWQKRTSASSNSILATDDTGIYVAVETYSNYFNNDAINLFKLDSDGVLIWNNTIGSREDYYVNDISVKNEKITVSGYTYVMANDYYNAFVTNLPTDGTLSIQDDDSNNMYNLSGITNYLKGNYVIQSVTSSFYESITPQVATHSLAYTRDKYIISDLYDIDNNIDKINEDCGILFGDGTKQTSSAGIIPQNYQPFDDYYYLKLSDIGRHVYRDTDSSSKVIIPTNKNVPFPIGTAISVVSGRNWCYFDVDDNQTEIWGAGFNTTSNYFYIPENSMATLLKIGIDKWMVSGAGLGNDD